MVFVAYVALAELGHRLVLGQPNLWTWWPASAFTFAVFYLSPPRSLPALTLSVFLAEVGITLFRGVALPVSISWGVADALEPVVSTLVLRRLLGPGRLSLGRLKDVLAFAALGALAGPAAGATVAATSSAAGLGTSFWTEWHLWLRADALSVLIFAPVILALASEHSFPPEPARRIEGLVLFATIVGVSQAVFGQSYPSAYVLVFAFPLFPVVMWAALRFGVLGAVLASALLAAILLMNFMAGRGPMRALGPPHLQVLAVQAYLALISLTAMLLAASDSERERAVERERLLVEASAVLGESFDYEATLARVTRLVVGSFADWCGVDVVDDGHLRSLPGSHRDPTKEAVFRELTAREPVTLESPDPSAQVMRSGVPLVLHDLKGAMAETTASDAAASPLVGALGAGSLLVFPMRAGEQLLGTLSLGSAVAYRFEPADVAFCEELARRAAMAINNARLYQATEEAVRSRDEFLSIASHELYTPLTSLQLALQGLQRGMLSVSPEAAKRATELGERQVKKLSRLVEELLSVSRIQAGRLELALAEVDLSSVARDVAEHFRQDLARAASTLSVDAREGVVGHWDRSKLEQVMTNLLANAIKFGAGRSIEVVVTRSDGTARLVVRDHGIGIAPERLPHVFERFERGVPLAQYGGMGLGLFIVEQIVSAHGGSVAVESTLGEGSTFTVTLPCTPSPPEGSS